jgi:hypothetical protein
LIASALVLLSTVGIVEGSVGAGGCPKYVNVAYESTMQAGSALYLHAIDTLIYNGYTLAQLIG